MKIVCHFGMGMCFVKTKEPIIHTPTIKFTTGEMAPNWAKKLAKKVGNQVINV